MELQTMWGWKVAVDLFMGGLGAGAFCTAAIIGLVTGQRFKNTVKFGAWVGVLSVILGVLALMIEVGQPFRAIVIFNSFVNFGSWMTIGAWLLFSAIVVFGLYALSRTDRVLRLFARWKEPSEGKLSRWLNILAIIGIPLGLSVAVYTGMLLNNLPFIPFWHTELLPVLFTASALLTGVAIVACYAIVVEQGKGVAILRRNLAVSLIVLVAAQGAILWYFLQTMLNGSADAASSAQILTSGALGTTFWTVVVALGLAVPLLVFINELIHPSFMVKRATLTLPLRTPVAFSISTTVALPILGIALCLVGGLVLRFLVLSVGLHSSLSSPAIPQILDGINFIP